jgi:competence protein ComEC
VKKSLIVLFVGAVLLLGLFCYYHFFQFTGFRVIFFNIGQGDSALINFSNGQKMLVDCGPDKKILSKLGQYLPFYDRTIDYLLISHPDGDHYGGCVDVLRRYDVKNIIENGLSKENDPYWQVWNENIKNKMSKIKNITRHELWTIAGTSLEFFSPDGALGLAAKEKDSNNSSIVFKLSHESKSFLFMGDAEVSLENALVDKHCTASSTCPALRATYLKVGHHGSDSSSGDDFIRAVAPQIAIISVGKNTFGHPSLRVMRHLERALIEIWRTDQKNDIILR